MALFIVVLAGLGIAYVALAALVRVVYGRRGVPDDAAARRTRLLVLCAAAAALALLLMGAAASGYRAVCRRCDELNRQAAEDVVRALVEYRRGHGAYPTALEDLVPGYLDAAPADRCDPFTPRPFELHECQSGTTLLVIPSADRSQLYCYHLQGEAWLGPAPAGGELYRGLAACAEFWQ